MSSAQQLIESAYARSVANDAGKLASDGELLLHLNRKYQFLYAIMAIAGGDNALQSAQLALVGSPAAIGLPGAGDIIDIKRAEKTDGSKIYIIPADEKDRTWHLAPAMYRQGNQLVSRGKVGDQVAGDSFVLYYLDAPGALVTLASITDPRFPVRFEDILVLDLAIYMSTKDADRPEKEYKALLAELADAMGMFNVLTKGSNTAKERTSTRDGGAGKN